MAKKHRSWVEIDSKALLGNFSVFRKSMKKKTRIMAVVKSNAYGHGMIEVANVLKNRADFFGVDDVLEAFELRKAGIKKPILVFGYTLPIHYEKAARAGISLTISSLAQLRNLTTQNSQLKTPLKIHLKVDTGLHRQGISPNEVSEALKIIQNSNIELEGVYSHFASAENPESLRDVKFTEKQIAIFKKVLEKIKKSGFKPIAHISGSAATFLLKDAQFDMVRVGISLYGLWPSEETRKALSAMSSRYASVLQPAYRQPGRLATKLRPVLSWKSIISEVKFVKKGEFVGYDLTERLEKDTMLAIVPVGYWHGYPRALSNKAYVLVKGQRSKVIGRVSMDMIIIDVTRLPAQAGAHAREGDEVVLLGRSTSLTTSKIHEEITAGELANLADSINYEIITRINPSQPRLLI